jgi:hypothetical protein
MSGNCAKTGAHDAEATAALRKRRTRQNTFGSPATLLIDRLGDDPEDDPEHGHPLAGSEVLLVERARSAFHSANSSYSRDSRPSNRRPAAGGVLTWPGHVRVVFKLEVTHGDWR